MIKSNENGSEDKLKQINNKETETRVNTELKVTRFYCFILPWLNSEPEFKILKRFFKRKFKANKFFSDYLHVYFLITKLLKKKRKKKDSRY